MNLLSSLLNMYSTSVSLSDLKTSIKDGTFHFNPEVVLEKAHSANGEDIDSILERVSKQSRQSQVNTDTNDRYTVTHKY